MEEISGGKENKQRQRLLPRPALWAGLWALILKGRKKGDLLVRI